MKSTKTILCSGLDFTPAFAALFGQAPIVARTLILCEVSCAELTPTEFHKLVLHLSPTVLIISCHLRARHITDEFIRTLSKNSVLCLEFPHRGPVDGDGFGVTDDAIVELCAQEDVQIDQERERLEELHVHSGSFTKRLFKRLVKVSVVRNV